MSDVDAISDVDPDDDAERDDAAVSVVADNAQDARDETERPRDLPDETGMAPSGEKAEKKTDEVEVAVEEDDDETSSTGEPPEMTAEEKEAMHAAVKAGDVELLDDLLDLPGADLNMTWFSENLLMTAIRARQQAMAEFLIDNGVNYSFNTTKIEYSEDGTGRALDWFTIDCRQMAYEHHLPDVVDLIDEKTGYTWSRLPRRVRVIRYKKPLEEKLLERTAEDDDITAVVETTVKKQSGGHNVTIQESVESINTDAERKSSDCSCPTVQARLKFLRTGQPRPERATHTHRSTKTSLSRRRVNVEYAKLLVEPPDLPFVSSNGDRWATPRTLYSTTTHEPSPPPRIYIAAQRRIKSAPCLEQTKTFTKLTPNNPRPRAKTALVVSLDPGNNRHKINSHEPCRRRIYPDMCALSCSRQDTRLKYAGADSWLHMNCTSSINNTGKTSTRLYCSSDVNNMGPLSQRDHNNVYSHRIGQTSGGDRLRHTSRVQGAVDLGAVARHRGLTSPRPVTNRKREPPTGMTNQISWPTMV